MADSILDRIKNTLLSQGKSALDAAKADLLRQGGNVIASTPEGQQGIQEELLRRGTLLASEIPWGKLLIGAAAVYVLTRRSRR
jgi:hypothetical protein